MAKLILATRGSPLALKQAELCAAHLEEVLPNTECELLKITTTGDRKTKWSLEKEGGKGLFTKELEEALLEGRAQIAVHSAKDLPTEMPEGLTLAAFMPREAAHDVLVVRDDVEEPAFIGTSSPRRRSQLKKCFPKAVWGDIRGNVDTRLRKVTNGHQAEATILAAAGLKRLGINGWPGLIFKPLNHRDVVPAVGQGAIALQTTLDFAPYLAPADHRETRRAVTLERRFLAAMGGGCHVATAAHVDGLSFLAYHDEHGFHEIELPDQNPEAAIDKLAKEMSDKG